MPWAHALPHHNGRISTRSHLKFLERNGMLAFDQQLKTPPVQWSPNGWNNDEPIPACGTATFAQSGGPGITLFFVLLIYLTATVCVFMGRIAAGRRRTCIFNFLRTANAKLFFKIAAVALLGLSFITTTALALPGQAIVLLSLSIFCAYLGFPGEGPVDDVADKERRKPQPNDAGRKTIQLTPSTATNTTALSIGTAVHVQALWTNTDQRSTALGPGDADEDMADAAPGEAAGEAHNVPVLHVDIDACVDTLYYRDVASDACGVVYVR